MKQAQVISDPAILNGKPIIAGTRISVELILDRLSSGMSEKEILNDYPHLKAKHIQSALTYAKDQISQKNNQTISQPETPALFTHEISGR